MPYWADDAFFYHVYPLGFCGAPPRNDFSTSPTPRLEQLYGWLDHLEGLGVNALYLPLYAFAHNHDVNRVAGNLTNPAHLYPLYALLLTMPEEAIPFSGGKARITATSCWARVMTLQ